MTDGPCITLHCPSCGAINLMWVSGKGKFTCRLCGAVRGPRTDAQGPYGEPTLDGTLAQVEAALAIHQPDEVPDGRGGEVTCCVVCVNELDEHVEWPCPTARALGVAA